MGNAGLANTCVFYFYFRMLYCIIFPAGSTVGRWERGKETPRSISTEWIVGVVCCRQWREVCSSCPAARTIGARSLNDPGSRPEPPFTNTSSTSDSLCKTLQPRPFPPPTPSYLPTYYRSSSMFTSTFILGYFPLTFREDVKRRLINSFSDTLQGSRGVLINRLIELGWLGRKH